MIHGAIRAFIAECRDDSTRREALALELARWQRDRNGPYGRLHAGEPRSIREIPAVPVDLFRALDLTCFPMAERVVTFRTSGTTGADRGAHHFRDLATYGLSATTWAARRLGNPPRRVVSLCPPGGGDSSLGHMVDLLADEVVQCFEGGAVDVERAIDALSQGPVFLATTAFALDALLAVGTAALDARSLVMVTGGFKGRRVRLDAAELYRAIPRLGAPRVVGEYGMTELSSQLWTSIVPAGQVPTDFVAPPWMYVYAVDPASGDPVAGEGLLRFVDLANVDSVVAVETMDLGVVDGARVELRGRLSGATLRGCSLTVEG